MLGMLPSVMRRIGWSSLTSFKRIDRSAIKVGDRFDADQDPELDRRYHLDDEQITVLVARCGVAFDRFQLRSADLVMGRTAP
jgi:hypothetical protein